MFRSAITYTIGIGLVVGAAFGAEKTTTTEFSVYVGPIVRWLDDNQDGQETLRLNYDPAHPEQNEASRAFRLALNLDITLQAEVTPFTNPNDPTDILDTTWMIDDDKQDDPAKTGALLHDRDAHQGFGAFVPAEQFLKQGVRITHQPGDGNVKLLVTARGVSAEPKPAATYEATIRLIAIPQTVMAFRPEQWAQIASSVYGR